jgi:hypothetical protein
MNIKGTWKKRSDPSLFPDNSFPKNQFAQANNRLDKMQKLLQAAYPDPKGVEAEWYRTISGSALVKGGPAPYELNALFLIYFCNANKIELGDETQTWFYVFANQFNWFADYQKYYRIDDQPVYLLSRKLGEFKGYGVYGGIHSKGLPGQRIGSSAIIITRPGQSPYLPVSRKQFLQAFLNYNESRNSKTLADMQNNMHFKTDEEEEADKKKNLEIIERVTSADKLARAKDNFLKNYITDKQRKEGNIDKMKKRYEEDMKPARDLLSKANEQYLAQASILDFDNMLEFKEFATEEKGGRQLVRLNPDYFNSKLPKYVAQFLIVYWRWDDAKPGINFKNQLETHFNFDALKEMIDQ